MSAIALHSRGESGTAPGIRGDTASNSSAEHALPSDALFSALGAIGVDYRYGGKSHATGFDCSGLVAHVFREAFGILLPHNTKAQSNHGKAVAAEALEPGDLVFYNTLGQPFSHVGIFIGDGRFIHAPRTGSAVRTETMLSAYWTKRYNGARRIGPGIIARDDS